MLQVEIRVIGQIAEHWSAWFEGLTITPNEQGETILCGEVIDQAALYGLLAKVRDLGLSLVSVNLVAQKPEEANEIPLAQHSDPLHPAGLTNT